METTPAAEVKPAHTPPERTRPWTLLRSPDFVKLFAVSNLSLVGDFFSYVALAWLVLQVTGSSLALGGVLVVQAVPRSILIAVGGAVVDRLSARVTMLASMGLRVVAVGPLAVVVLTGHVQMWEVYVASAVFGVVDAFFMPARSSILPRLVADRDLEPANAFLNVSSQVAIVAGPALAGVVVAAFGTGWAFAVDAACFAVGLPIVLWLPAVKRAGEEGAAQKPKGGIGGEIVAGLRYAWSDVGIRATLVIVAAVDFGAQGAIGVGLPTLAHGRFDAGATGLGVLLAGWGLGATLGAAAAGVLPPPKRFGVAVVAACGWIGVCIIGIGLMPSLLPAIAVIAGAGLASGLINTYGMSWLQRRTDRAMQGRVMSLVFLASVGLVPVGNAVAGVLGEISPTLLFAAAGSLIVAAAAGAFSSRAVRAL
jgi:transmembrane secretion effector